jgi:hypothetical protein
MAKIALRKYRRTKDLRNDSLIKQNAGENRGADDDDDRVCGNMSSDYLRYRTAVECLVRSRNNQTV